MEILLKRTDGGDTEPAQQDQFLRPAGRGLYLGVNEADALGCGDAVGHGLPSFRAYSSAAMSMEKV